MMLILVFDVKNLVRKIIIIMIMIIIIIIIILIMKTKVAIKAVLIIKIMSPHHRHHKTQKKLCSYLEMAW